MQSSFTDTGFVLKQIKYKEADKIVFIFSLHHGVVELVAKGARKQSSRKSGHLDSLNLVKFHASRSRFPQILSQIDTIDSFHQGKTNLDKINACFLVSELLFSLLPSQEPHQALFVSLGNFLSRLNNIKLSSEVKKLSNQFCSYTIRHLGYPEANSNKTSVIFAHLESIMDRSLHTANLILQSP